MIFFKMRLLILLSLFSVSTAKTRITTDYRDGGYESAFKTKCQGGGKNANWHYIPSPQVTPKYNANAKFTASDITGYKTSTYNWKSQPYPNHHSGWFELVGEEHLNRYGNGGPTHATIVAAAEDTCMNIDKCMMTIIYRHSGGRGTGLKAAFYWDNSLCILEESYQYFAVAAIRFQKPPAKCSTLTCPSNYISKTSAGTINCASDECTANDDRDTCCDLTASCTTLTCPTSFIKKASSETIHCADRTCGDSDRDTCCDALGKCSTLTCQKSYVTKDPNIECKAATCTDDDRDTCCEIELCGENEHAFNGTCHNCPAGKTNAAGDPATVDSECDTTFCLEDYHVVNNICQPCALGTRSAGDDASKGDTMCDVGPCGGLTCVRGTCKNGVCDCPIGYSGMTCDRDVTANGRASFLRSKRKALPTKQDIIQTQRDIRTFVRDTLRKALLTKSTKQAIRETKMAVQHRDLKDRARVVAIQLEKQPVIAVSSVNKDTQDTCKQGVNSARCSMLDIKENPDEIIFLNTQEEAGSWSVLNSGDKILSKQTKVSEDVYDMQCWAHQVIFVDAGVESGDFYNFYTDKACSNKISKDADGSYHLNKNTKYTFGRCAGATSHPFEVYPTGTTPAAVGISGDETKSVQSGDLTWVCTSHPGMTGTFKAVGDTDWSEKVRFDTTSNSDMYECNDHIILIGSQAAVCTDDTCKNGGTCATDGYSFTCTCPAGYTGNTCENQATITHCHQMDCSDYGGHKTGECTDCNIANCCNYATKSLFNNHCDGLTVTKDYVEAKCCHRTYCL